MKCFYSKSKYNNHTCTNLSLFLIVILINNSFSSKSIDVITSKNKQNSSKKILIKKDESVKQISNTIQDKITNKIQQNFSIFLALLALFLGFLLAGVFLLFAILYNNKILKEVELASYQIANSLSGLMNNKLSSDVLTLHI